MYLQDPLMRNDTIYPELQTTGGIRLNKLPECWQLKDRKNTPLTVKNYLLKHMMYNNIHNIKREK